MQCLLTKERRPIAMADKSKDEDQSTEKAAATLPGTVEKIIPPLVPSEPEKAQIAIEGADDLYRDAAGNPVSLKKGAEVEVTIEAKPEATTPKKPSEKK
jgi:hypothetical protein